MGWLGDLGSTLGDFGESILGEELFDELVDFGADLAFEYAGEKIRDELGIAPASGQGEPKGDPPKPAPNSGPRQRPGTTTRPGPAPQTQTQPIFELPDWLRDVLGGDETTPPKPPVTAPPAEQERNNPAGAGVTNGSIGQFLTGNTGMLILLAAGAFLLLRNR